MGRMIISPIGLSIFQGKHGLRRLGVRLTPGHEAEQVRSLLGSLGSDADSLSAELATLKALKANSQDKAVFLATDTDVSYRAASVNAAVAEHRFGVWAVAERIPSLGLEDAARFRREGIPNLVQKMDQYVALARGDGRSPLLNVSGGIKPVVPYVALYGMLQAVEPDRTCPEVA